MTVKQNKPNVVFSFDQMIASLKSATTAFTDTRTGKNKKYQMLDATLGAFSVFFTQCPSFLSHQELLQEKHSLDNARSLFGMRGIPSSNQIRGLLDKVNPTLLSSVFEECFGALQASGHTDDYRVSLGKHKRDLLLALDGTQYFSSIALRCDNCSKKIIDKETHYAHSMITPTIVAPGNNKVISLTPEYITPQDGDSKQDCELKASKRWLARSLNKYKLNEATILGDDLYSHEPFCLDMLAKGLNFILVCKPDSHKTLYEWTRGITKEVSVDRLDGNKHLLYTYSYAEGVPLRDHKDALLVNFIEVTVIDRKTQTKLYHNAFVTNHKIEGKTDKQTRANLAILIDAGRARWKIENENNNTLKTQGYHLEHNFGHGKKYLSSLLAGMNILAFLFHTMLEFMNHKYKLLRKVFRARKRLFESIRVLLIYHPYMNFESLMDFMLEGPKMSHALEKLRYPL